MRALALLRGQAASRELGGQWLKRRSNLRVVGTALRLLKVECRRFSFWWVLEKNLLRRRKALKIPSGTKCPSRLAAPRCALEPSPCQRIGFQGTENVKLKDKQEETKQNALRRKGVRATPLLGTRKVVVVPFHV